MKKILYLLILISMFLVGCGNSVPTEEQITRDLQEELSSSYIENPFTERIELEELEITNFEIEKSQTADTVYIAYCVVDLENDYYRWTRYIACEYEKYDGGKWELDSWEDYQDPVSVAYENPFTIEELENKYRIQDNYSNVQIDMVFEENKVLCSCTYDVEHKYKTYKAYKYDEYYYNGKYWDNMYHEDNGKSEWNIEGYWELEDTIGSPMFVLSISTFDTEDLAASGYCKFGYEDRWIQDYHLEIADIQENDRGALIIMLDGDINSSILGLGYDDFVVFEANDAYAYYGATWRKETIIRTWQ